MRLGADLDSVGFDETCRECGYVLIVTECRLEFEPQLIADTVAVDKVFRDAFII